MGFPRWSRCPRHRHDQGQRPRRIKEFTCSQHAVVLPMAKCDFIDYINLHKTGATSSRIERIAPPTELAMHGPVARRFFEQMVAGTWHLHELGIAHLDLKLENMLMGSLGRDATLMISDFGMSKKVGSCRPMRHADRKRHRELRAAGGVLPERLRRSPTATSNAFAVDVWTLGVCLAMLVIGRSRSSRPSTSRTRKARGLRRDAGRAEAARGANGCANGALRRRIVGRAVALRQLSPGLAAVAARQHAACGPGDPSYARPGRRTSVGQRDPGAYAAGARRPATPLVGGGAAGGRRPATPLVGGDRRRTRRRLRPMQRAGGAARRPPRRPPTTRRRSSRYNACSAAPTAAPGVPLDVGRRRRGACRRSVRCIARTLV